jgi:hypothetical protein
MIYKVPTRHEELTLLIKVRTHKPEKIRIRVLDADQPSTTFTDRYKTVDGESIFFVRMPVSPKNALVSIYNENNGNLQEAQDNTFEVDSITKESLDKKLMSRNFVLLKELKHSNFCSIASWNIESLLVHLNS